MSLRDAVDGYIAWRRAHGAKFDAGTYLLHQFCKLAGGNTGCDAIAEADVLSFLSGKGPLTAYRANKHSALAGFYRYAISRGYATSSPLPARDAEPRRPRPAPPYVYSRNELQRLFGAIDASRQRSVQLGADTLRALLLLLYGAGLRLGEAERLTLEDADLPDALLTIRDAKFYKARLVPVAPQLADALRANAAKRAERPLPKGTASTFLAKPGWHALGQRHNPRRVRQVAQSRRNRCSQCRTASSVPSLPAPCCGRSPAGVLVPAGRRRPAVAAGARHLARPRRSQRHPSLSVHDARAAARGFGPLQHLCQRRRP